MGKFAIVGIVALAVVGTTALSAQQGPRFREHVQHTRLSPEDRAALADARIAAIHAGLKLTPDQEKLWPPVEAALKDFAKMRIDRANARMKAQASATDQPPKDEDPTARERERADRMAATAAALKKIADAAAPLYKTFDDGQKRRFMILTHRGKFFGGGHRWTDRGSEPGMKRG